ncbi:MAG: hypothetical protein AAF799_08560 [Myxococcota bacterium]
MGIRRLGLGLMLSGLGLASGCPSDGAADTSTGTGTAGDSTGSSSEGPVGVTGSGSTAVADSSGGAASSSSDDGGPVQPPGEFDVLTYNVAALPQGLSSSNPEVNIPLISPLLNDFPMVLVQEDFWYHAQLAAEVTLPHQSMPWSEMPTLEDIGDGLNRFGEHPFADHERVAWYACNGTIDCASDCLATKGWSFARHTLAEGVEIDVYNLHMEAGGCPEDLEIRLNSAQDLVDAIDQRSAGRALIVAGDFNLRATDPEDVEPLAIITDGAGLTDACDAVGCPDQLIDHVMVRSSDDLDVEVLQWWVPEQFVTRGGEPLSDHLPVAATLRYTPR